MSLFSLLNLRYQQHLESDCRSTWKVNSLTTSPLFHFFTEFTQFKLN